MQPNPTDLHQFLLDHYDGEELRTLCFQLGVVYDDLRGEGRQAKARELVAYLDRQRQLGRLSHHLWITRRELIRQMELTYLDDLLNRYDYWREHYTPLAGITEVRAAVKDGPRLDLPMPFVPPGFEKLLEHQFGERPEPRRLPVNDIQSAIDEHRRILLLGDPGSGKTTTLWRLAYEYAQKAQSDASAPLALFVPLGGYTGDGPFDAYLARHLGPLAPFWEHYRADGRLILLLDGLNEMPQQGYAERVGRIQQALSQYPDEQVIVTCRALDYVVALKRLQKVEISPLDVNRIRTFVHNYLGETAGERLFWALAGDDEVAALWETWREAGGTWDQFWTGDEMPSEAKWKISYLQHRLWKQLRRTHPQLLELSRNPFMLLMTAQVYAQAEGRLPRGRGRVFAAFVDTLLDREQERHPELWIDAGRQKSALASLAYEMQQARGSGTSVEREQALDWLGRAAPDCDAERVLYLAASATLLDAGDTTVRFYHQLLQEYFAACELGRRVAAGESLERYWPGGRWWEPSGWEETVVLLAGMEAEAAALLEGLVRVNPVVAARCLTEGGAQAGDQTKQTLVRTLAAAITDPQPSARGRIQAGDQLALLGDPRDLAELATVPAGPFLMGSTDADEMAHWDDEKPEREVTLDAFRIGKYPVTNARFAAFVQAGGYAERRYWTDAGWEWKEREGWRAPHDYGRPFNLSNHPVGVSWYEAVAYCRWLAEVWRAQGVIGPQEVVRLPTDAEWEKAARGTDGRRFPWGDEPDPERANYDDRDIGTTSAVGVYPGGASPYGLLDMSGNVWEWCSTLWQDEYPLPQKDEWAGTYLAGTSRRVLRGGSFYDDEGLVRGASRDRGGPEYRYYLVGLRVVVAFWP